MLATAPLPTRLPAAARVTRWRAPDGWAHRRIDVPGSGRGRVLILGGRADVIEKYVEVVAHLGAAGWAVTSVDWRGQGGSGRLGVGDIGHVECFDALEDDLAAFWAGWQGEDAGPLVVLAHSMGAHVTLRALAAGRIAPAAIVLSAPMVQIRSPVGQVMGGRIARWMCANGPATRAAWKVSDEPAARRRRLRRLTVDESRGQDDFWWEAEPMLKLGPPSWGWIAEAFRSGIALRQDARLAAVTTPTLFLVPEADRLVNARASLAVAARMPSAEVVRFGPEAGHEILREGLAVRDRAFAAIDRFLTDKAPA